MTNQEAFDKAVNGLLKQGKFSMLNTKACAYRAPDGSKCAVGMLIADEEYKPEMENARPRKLQQEFGILKEYNPNFLLALQLQLHDIPALDGGDFETGVKEGARKVAHKWNLKYEV